MTYVRGSRRYRLKWDDGDYKGMEVVTKSASLDDLGTIMELAGKPDVDSTMQLMELFAKYVTEWSIVEEDGTPTPATLDGLKSLDIGEIVEIITKWSKAVTQVSEELGKESTSGETPPEASIPMETL